MPKARHFSMPSVSRSDAKGSDMAKKALKEKAERTPKYKVRGYTRCKRCGRPKAVFRKFGLCRVCLRELVHAGEIPGVRKASWRCVVFGRKTLPSASRCGVLPRAAGRSSFSFSSPWSWPSWAEAAGSMSALLTSIASAGAMKRECCDFMPKTSVRNHGEHGEHGEKATLNPF